MDYEPSGQLITSVLELKLDTATMFEWQKHSQSSTEVPHYQDLLEFIDLRAQASETSTVEQAKGSSRTESSLPNKSTIPNRPQLTSFITSTSGHTGNNCVACNDCSKHPLYACSKFKALSHKNKLTLLKNSKLCFNCLKPGHFVKMCKSNQHCKACQRPHHTLLHIEPTKSVPNQSDRSNPNQTVQSYTATELSNSTLLMMCYILVHAPSDLSVKARAVLDSASSTSFISEQLAQILCLPRSHIAYRAY